MIGSIGSRDSHDGHGGGGARRLLLKVVLIGDGGVGKTSLMLRSANRAFRERYQATVCADFETKEVQVRGQAVTLQIVDTVGQQDLRSSVVPTLYRDAAACMLVCDLGSKESFDSLDQLHRDFLELGPRHEDGDGPFPLVLLCNKADLSEEERQVTAQQVEEWCVGHGGVPHYFTSAKDGTNVELESPFRELAERLLPEEVEIPEIPEIPPAIARPPAGATGSGASMSMMGRVGADEVWRLEWMFKDAGERAFPEDTPSIPAVYP